jgi:hypothetical protein
MADATGSLAACPLVIPAASAGMYSVVVTDSTGDAASAPFTIVPVLILSTAVGPVGGRALVAGRGFASSALISIAFDGIAVATCGDVAPASLSVIPVISLAAGAGAQSATVGGPGFAALGSVAALLDLCMLLECAAVRAALVRALEGSTATMTVGCREVEYQPGQMMIDMARNRTILSDTQGPRVSLNQRRLQADERANLHVRASQPSPSGWDASEWV